MCPFERKHACFRRTSRSASERKRPYGNAYGNAIGTSAVCLRSVVEFSGENGAPERIRTADPQIRSLGAMLMIPGYVELVAAASLENLGLVLSGRRISELCRLVDQI